MKRMNEGKNYNNQILLGKKIRFLRKKRRWTVEVLSLETGINRNYICDIENGRRNPTLQILEKFAKAFNISLKELFDFELLN
mgnify:CR=1 FL=1